MGAYVHPGVVETVVCPDKVEAKQLRQAGDEMWWRPMFVSKRVFPVDMEMN